MIAINGNKFLLRSPLYPVQWADQCFAGDHERWMEQEAFHYGLYLSSAELYQEFQKQKLAGDLTPKMLQTLRKYWLRSSTRCTPYANFAGCAVGEIGDHTSMIIGAAEGLVESCRLDMDLLHRFVKLASLQPGITAQLKWITNNSLYKQGKKFRFVRHELHNNKRNYFLSEVAYNTVLMQVLKQAATASSYAALQAIILKAGLDEADADHYLQSLIENQLLVHELEPAISGEQPMQQLIQRFAGFENLETQCRLLKELESMLSTDHFSINRLQSVIDTLDNAGFDRSGVQTLFQSDLYLHTTQNTLSGNVLNDVLDETEKLIQAIYPFRQKYDELSAFRERFLVRYEAMEVPLCEVLDVEYGIGYGHYNNNTTSLVNDLVLPPARPPAGDVYAQMMQRKKQAAIDEEPVILTDADLDELIKAAGGDSGYRGRQSAGILGSLYGKNAEDIDAGNFSFFIRLISGPSGANLLGRFCHVHEAIHHMTRCITASEAAELPASTVFAEIIHLPQDRIGNILLRPVLREYEIPFLGNSGAVPERQLRIDDLMVSVRNGLVLLRSKTLNKYVIPRLSTAHNFMFNSLPMYRFLCELQWQYSFRGLFFEEKGEADFYPEVRYKHLILQRARWKLSKEDLLGVPSAEQLLPVFINEWRRKKNLPQQLLLLDNDNELLIDLRYPESFLMLAAAVNKQDTCIVAAFPGKEAMGAVSGNDGNYCNEIYIPVMFGSADEVVLPLPEKQLHRMPQRSFLPGSEWLYFKIYCGTSAGEELLSGVLKKLCERIQAQGFADRFFFIRYYDPDPHVRLRYRLTAPSHMAGVMKLVHEAMQEYVAQKLITKIQIDTYTRELERYDPRLINEAEHIFHADSVAVMSILQLLYRHEAAALKWQLGIAGINQYLVDFGYDLEQKTTLIRQLQQGFLQEFGGGKPLLQQLNNKHRECKQELAAVLSDQPSALMAAGMNILNRRSRQIAPVVRKIRHQLRRDKQTPDKLLGSFLHMFIDRLFDTDNRKYELLLYHLLLKHYTSITAMQQKQRS